MDRLFGKSKLPKSAENIKKVPSSVTLVRLECETQSEVDLFTYLLRISLLETGDLYIMYKKGR